jgi:hypothetical protein
MSIQFKDINFKLCVVQELMYVQNLLKPQFELERFVADYKAREIDTETEGYEIIPEVLDYFRQLDIPAGLLPHVTKIYQDGGNDIYMQLCPFWNGEDDQFNIRQTDDIALLPNLKKATLFYDEDAAVLGAFRNKGIETDYL